MGDVVDLQGSSHGLRVTHLVPEERAAWFEYTPEDDKHYRARFALRENGEILAHDQEHIHFGGRIHALHDNEPVPEKLLGPARRMARTEFSTWDDLRVLDRLGLQLHWAQEALRQGETDLIAMLNVPFEEGERPHGRFDTGALAAQVDWLVELVGKIDGIEKAISSL